jgi:hypothetical protein
MELVFEHGKRCLLVTIVNPHLMSCVNVVMACEFHMVMSL